MSITIYMDYLSQPSRAVLSLCKLAKIPHQIKQVKISKLQTRSPQYKKINPMGLVPSIQDTSNNFKLAESHAIMRYLCSKYPQNIGDLYPPCILKRAKIDQYLDFHHTNTRKCSFYIFNTVFAKNLGIPVSPQYVEADAKKVVEKALTAIEKNYMTGNYIVGDKMTLADLSAYFEITFLYFAKFSFEKWPKIQAWILRVGQVAEIQQANKIFVKLILKTNPAAKL